MEITEDRTQETEPAKTTVIVEAWSFPLEDDSREFEEYLMEIGLRF